MRCCTLGTDNPSGRKFWKECGGRMALARPSVGAAVIKERALALLDRVAAASG